MQHKVRQLAADFFEDTVAIRRHLHQHPELSFQEKETASFISAQLTAYGIAHETEVSGYGIVALIEGNLPASKCIAIRADMDALPINENSDKPYCSMNNVVMHACGHDAHTAILLVGARILNHLKSSFQGTIKLIFQPAEEKLPGGALGMIEAGVLKNPDVDAILGLHVLPTLDAGTIGFRSGPFMASGDEINIKIKGKGGHAAMPDQCNDTVLIASQTVVNLQQIVSRHAPPLIPTVLSFGRLIANGAHNIIPSEVLIQGTFRTFDESWRKEAKEHIRRIASLTAEAGGAKAEIQIMDGYPVLLNNEKITTKAFESAQSYLTPEKVMMLDQRMTTEDFAWYTHIVPACFFRLGTGNAANDFKPGLHTDTFDIDEKSLQTGTGSLAWIALQLLKP
ncbi:MAG: amidohydrolase [Bacteroidetes bacterium HGW-Bacteroidetes-1]|jgi:hippurate hydrolase|nr:MAG: amidohydrolase [Bacteroidetes bacterium HGW-Bacteroidetes-1]